MRDRLKNMCRDLEIPFESHDSHGFYLDVQVAGQELIIDPTPDSIWREGKLVKSWPNGTCFVRDASHHYSKPTHLVRDSRYE